MIVVEGVDNSGKSTLIRSLQVVLPNWTVQASEGPPKHKGEMDERVTRYLSDLPPTTIFDRHPCVSQPIYNLARPTPEVISPGIIRQFYSSAPLFIYCDGGARGMLGHTVNPETDTPGHLDAVNNNYVQLLLEYRRWAIEHAFMTYRIGDSMSRVVKTVEHLVSIGRV